MITNLYRKKIDELDTKFYRNRERSVSIGFLKISLLEIVDLFLNNEAVTYEDIYNIVSARTKPLLDDVIAYLNEEGFLYTYIKQEDEFSTPVTLYSWGSQPALDYLLAQKLYSKLQSGEDIFIEFTNGIYQMLSLVAIEKGQALCEYQNIITAENVMFDLMCYALSNCSVSVASNYRDYVNGLLSKSPALFREVVNQIVLPVSNIEDHPLGAELLDAFLRGFDTPSERDIWWSIPANLRYSFDTDWCAYTEVNFGSIELKPDDKYNSMPLILAWSLTSVNNKLRQISRMKLTEWGIGNPQEYWRLFCACYNSNDIQMVEDIFAIAYGVSLDHSISDKYLEDASRWMIDNVFSADGLEKYIDASIRYYALGIVKIAISKGLCDERFSDKIRPPYHSYKIPVLPLCKDAFDAKRMGGFSPIDYDLARYVLCDRFDNFFKRGLENQNYNANTKKFIDKYVSRYNIPEFSVDGFIISCAYQFLLDQGWSLEKFWTDKDKKNYGVDVVIHRNFFPATHGSMSNIMNIAEKNVWLARHRIEAILADEIEYYDWSGTFEFISDYTQLDNFINTYQDYIIYKNKDIQTDWFNVKLLANPEFDEMILERICDWIQDEYLPDFKKWLSPVNDNIILNTFTNV